MVVLVVVDTLRADEFPRDSEPGHAFESWARKFSRGARIHRNAYSSSGWTLPAVASILTGLDPEVHHAHGKATLLAPLSPDVTTLAEAFQANGFRTVAVTNAAFLSPLLGLDRGFDVYDHAHAYNRSLRRAAQTTSRALKYVRESNGEDLFLFVHIFDPHLDYDPLDATGLESSLAAGAIRPPVSLAQLRELQESGAPTESQLREIRACYRAEVEEALEAVGRLYHDLASEDPLREMRFALTSDHGEEFFEHGGFEHGHSLHTELVHVPLVIDYTFTESKDEQVLDGVVSTRDLGRRLLESLWLEVPASFAPSTSDWNGEGGGMAYSATTLYGPDRIALRTDAHSVLLELREGDSALGVMYDLEVDAGELQELEVDPELREKLLDRRRANRAAGEHTRRLDWLDLGPSKHKERDATLKSLESLGYTGSGRDED